MDEMNVYIFGDSVAFGQGISICDTWVCKTALYLREQYPQQDITVHNTSVNGNTTRMALERMPHDIQGRGVDILAVEFGMNDCNYWDTDCGCARVSPMAFQANLCEIIQRAQIFRTKKVLLLTNHVSGRNGQLMKHAPFTYQQNNERYNQIIREVAAMYRGYALLVDIEKSFKTEISRSGNADERVKEFLQQDLIHLSKLGHEFYYHFFVKALAEVIDELDAASNNGF